MLRSKAFSIFKALGAFSPRQGQKITQSRSLTSSSDGSSSKPSVYFSHDDKTVFCWHPEPEFPYEHSKPMPRKDSEMEMADSVLKVQYLKRSSDGPTQEELMKMFHTPRHRWDPKPAKRYERPPIPHDRESI